MGMYPMPTPKTCPGCGRSLQEPPAALRVAVKGFPAEVAYGTNPVCGARWHVWDKTSPSACSRSNTSMRPVSLRQRRSHTATAASAPPGTVSNMTMPISFPGRQRSAPSEASFLQGQ